MLAACVIFYQPHPHYLDRTLASLAGKVDKVILLDGPYDGLSSVERSSPDVYDAIHLYRNAVDMVVPPAQTWKSEPYKRTVAAIHAQAAGADRVLVIDSDEALIDPVPEGDALTALLLQDGNPTARMMRVYPAGCHWGPTHATVTKGDTTYWTPDDISMSDRPYDFRILHTPADKRIQREYEAYNVNIRPLMEGQ